MISDTRTYRANPDTVSVDLDGQISLYAAANAQALLLNASASQIWHLLSTPHTVTQLADTLASRHGLPPDTIRADVAGAVADLVHRGVVIADG